MEEMMDCFARKNSNYCGALTEMVCKKRNCSFYLTKEQFKKGQEKYGNGEEYSEKKKG